MLRALHIKDVGPAARFDLELGERLNVLTGDNGLGKSFILEVAWWALTGTWTDRPVLPQRGKEESAEIGAEVDASDPRLERDFKRTFSRSAQRWLDRFRRDTFVGFMAEPGRDLPVPSWFELLVPVIYVRTGGSFSIWDPKRNHSFVHERGSRIESLQSYDFSESELWHGLQRDGRTLCNGLIQDWVTWQLEAEAGRDENHAFALLLWVLKQLSHPDEPMLPGNPARPYLDDVRRIPTIDLPYEQGVPVLQASAGMRRILGLSYLLAWAWTEHVQASRIVGSPPAPRMVVLLEEPETHLHPKWQRHIVPALLRVLSGLTAGAPDTQTSKPDDQTMRPQVLLTTHAPLVLASLEPHFDTARDKLFSFELKGGRDVVLEELPWTRYGDAVGWLTSEVFDMRQARSPEAERAITAAYDFMAERHDQLPDDLKTGDAIHSELQRVLAQQDPFWPRWLFQRERRNA